MTLVRFLGWGTLTITLLSVSINSAVAAAPSPAESCQLDLLAGYEGQGIRIHSTFQKTSDEFSNASGLLSYLGENSDEIPLSDGVGHLANGRTAVLSYRGGKTVVLVIDWQQGVVTSGSINGLPLVPSLSNTVGCQADVALSDLPTITAN